MCVLRSAQPASLLRALPQHLGNLIVAHVPVVLAIAQEALTILLRVALELLLHLEVPLLLERERSLAWLPTGELPLPLQTVGVETTVYIDGQWCALCLVGCVIGCVDGCGGHGGLV